jgi:hypothetical protein
MILRSATVATLALLAVGCKSRAFNQSEQSAAGAANPTGGPNCVFLGDLYEPKAKFPEETPKGKQGICIDTRTARPVYPLNNQAASRFSDPVAPVTYLANVTHRDQFYVAAIPNGDNDIEQVIFQEESFPAVIPAAHGQIRLDFRRDVLMAPQIEGQGEPFTTRHLVLSMEALGEPGWAYDVVKGLKNEFVGVWRIKTLADFAIRTSKKNPPHEVKQYLLPLENHPKERTDILRFWIGRSAHNKLSQMYHTITSSCAMEALNALESVRQAMSSCELHEPEQMNFLQRVEAEMKKTAKQGLFWLDKNVATPMEVYPTFAESALKARGLYKTRLPNLDQDPIYAELIK